MNKISNSTTEPSKGLKHYMLYYQLVPDILEKRTPYKDEHMKILHELSSSGLVFVGAEMIEGFPAVFMFEGKDDSVLQDWLKRDPYLNNGLVLEYRYNEIMIVAGKIMDM
jgi:uncharacterized protein YciI